MTKTTQYKNTPIGPIPTEWEVKKLGELGETLNGLTYSPKDIVEENEGILVLRSSNIQNDNLVFDDNVFVKSKNLKYNPVELNDILICVRNGSKSLIGKNALITEEAKGMAFGAFMSIYRSELNSYLYHCFKSDIYQNHINKNLGATINSINGSDLKQFSFPLPPLPEQQKIAEVLSTWDKAIQETDAIIKKLEARNKALATSLLTGESRIEGFKNSTSAKLEIKDVAKEISLKNKEDHNYTVFSCTKYNGLVPSLEYFGKKIYSDNLKTYKIIKRNQFAYATNHIEEGSMGILEKEDIGLISPMYTIFEFNENVNLDYIFKMLKSDFYINEYKRRMEGSIDRRGGLRWSAFAQIKINLPSLEEQNAIAEILNTANQEVKQYQQKLEALKLQKKGLMQQLLTGKVRTV